MAKFFKYAFGQAGILTPIPNDTQIDGSISYEQGFSTDYTLNPQFDPVTAKEVPLAQTNQYLNDITGAVQQYQTKGFPDFITAVDNDGVPYPYAINSYVRYNNEVYFSLIDNNTDTPPSANWELVDNTNPVNPVVKPALVNNSINQTSSISPTLLQFDQVSFDPDGIWTGGAASRFTPKVPGFYQFYCNTEVFHTAPGGSQEVIQFGLFLYKNGVYINVMGSNTLYFDTINFPVAASQATGINGTAVVYMNGTTDYAQIFKVGPGLTTFIGEPAITYFGANYISE